MTLKIYRPTIGKTPEIPLAKGSPSTEVSYSGPDIRAAVMAYGRMHELGNLSSFSYSTHRDLRPVRCLGTAGATAHASGYRTIAGTLVFTLFNKDAFFDMISFRPHDRAASGMFPILPDQIPPFNLLVFFGNEVVRSVNSPLYHQNSSNSSAESQLIIYGMVLSDGGGTSSINDQVTEAVFNYQARGLMPLTDVRDQSTVSGLYDFKSGAALVRQKKAVTVTPPVDPNPQNIPAPPAAPPPQSDFMGPVPPVAEPEIPGTSSFIYETGVLDPNGVRLEDPIPRWDAMLKIPPRQAHTDIFYGETVPVGSVETAWKNAMLQSLKTYWIPGDFPKTIFGGEADVNTPIAAINNGQSDILIAVSPEQAESDVRLMYQDYPSIRWEKLETATIDPATNRQVALWRGRF